MADYIPSGDAEFITWLSTFMSYAVEHQQALGLGDPQVAQLQTAQTEWETAYQANTAAQAAAVTARQAKDDARKDCAAMVREVVGILQASPSLTDVQRRGLGITVPDATKSVVGAPTTRPLGTIKVSGPLEHTIQFVDETTPTRKAKPSGVMGCEVWVHVGDPVPSDPTEFKFLGLDTRTPYVNQFDPEEAGQLAYYRLRWVNRKGEQGPWSQLISAMVTS